MKPKLVYVKFDQIISSIEKKDYAPIYLLHGEESYYIDEISDKLEKSILTEGEKAFNQTLLYGKDATFKDVIDNARQFPMMASYRVVIVNEAQQMKSLKQLLSYAENPSPQTVLVLNHKHKKIDSRIKLTKAIKKNGVVFESKKLYDNQVAPWITNYVKSKNAQIKADASMMLAEFLGSDLNKISNEVNKLILNLDSGSNVITVNHVTEQVGISKDYNVFELQKAISQKDTAKAFRIVDYFADNEKAHPLTLIIASLYSYWTKVYIAAFHKRKSDVELQRMIGLPTTFFVKEYRMAANNYPSQKIIESFDLLKVADMHSKGVGASHYDMKGILRNYLIRLFYN